MPALHLVIGDKVNADDNSPTMMEAVQIHMENDAELISEAGGDPSPETN